MTLTSDQARRMLKRKAGLHSIAKDRAEGSPRHKARVVKMLLAVFEVSDVLKELPQCPVCGTKGQS